LDAGGELRLLALSVVLPAHRADDYLLQALRTAETALSNLDAELIVVANGMDSEAVEQLVLRARTLPGTLVIRSGIPALIHCLNRGLEVARGEYVARFDSDDICLPSRFQHQLRIARETGADFLFGAAEIMRADGTIDGRTQVSGTALWRVCKPMHPTALMRRSAVLALGGYGNLEFSEDYHLWLRAASRGFRLVADPEPVIRYRVHPGQVTDKRKLTHTFASNAGIKLIAALRERSPLLLLGVLSDLIRYFYRVCRNAFS
jgi:glycosyltransferase involved in cell wall biosynthesis